MKNLNTVFLFLFFLVSLNYGCQSKKKISKNNLVNKPANTSNVEIKENEMGVHFKRFGGGVDTSKFFLPGKYDIPAYDRIIIYKLDTRSQREVINIQSKDDVSIDIVVKYTFKPIPQKIAYLEYYIGANFLKHSVQPRLIPVVKKYFENLLRQEISLENKSEFELNIFTKAKNEIEKKYVELESFHILEIQIKEN